MTKALVGINKPRVVLQKGPAGSSEVLVQDTDSNAPLKRGKAREAVQGPGKSKRGPDAFGSERPEAVDNRVIARVLSSREEIPDEEDARAREPQVGKPVRPGEIDGELDDPPCEECLGECAWHSTRGWGGLSRRVKDTDLQRPFNLHVRRHGRQARHNQSTF